jgi:uncharacterized protein with ParB-like and HNH nuclease domain
MSKKTKKQSLSAHEYPIKKIFCDDYLFKIPSYQRPYSWTTEHVSELVADLQECIKGKKEDVELLNSYFLGSIVLVKGDKSVSEVIDGQQRLTTLTILFSVLRNLIHDNSIKKTLAELIKQEGSKLLKTDDIFRVSLRSRDLKFFKTYIQEEDGLKKLLQLNDELKDSRFNIKHNAKCIHEILKNESQAELFRLAQFIVRECYIVVVATPDMDSAYRIFSVMNDRGLDLTATDILKSYIIGEIPNKEKQGYTDKWENMEENIGRDSFRDLFSHIRMIYRKLKPQGALVKEFNKHVKPKENPKNFIDTILVPYFESYQDILFENFESAEHAESINERLRWLNIIDNSDWIPLAILYIAKNRNSPTSILNFLCKLERLASCMMIFRGNINYRIKRISNLLRHIEEDKDLLDDNSLINLTPEEMEETVTALNDDVYKNTRTRLMILLRLDSILSCGTAKYKHKIVTIEHVLPQHPKQDSQWITWIPDEEKRKQLVHKLGNLVLLSRVKNSSAGNHELDKKIKSYFKVKGVSSFPITTDILSHKEWTEEIINSRQKKYLEILCKEWKLVTPKA